jgi:hypothetical protein
MNGPNLHAISGFAPCRTVSAQLAADAGGAVAAEAHLGETVHVTVDPDRAGRVAWA